MARRNTRHIIIKQTKTQNPHLRMIMIMGRKDADAKYGVGMYDRAKAFSEDWKRSDIPMDYGIME